MLLSTTGAELLKLRKRPAIWIISAIWLALSLLFGYAFPYISYRSGGGTGNVAGASPQQILASALPGHLAITAIQGMPMFAGALALILGALVSGSEYGWGTLKTVLTQRPGRLGVLAGKIAGLAVVLLVGLVVSFGLDAAAAALVAGVTDSPLDYPSGSDLAQSFVAGWLMIGAWSLLGLALGVLTRGTSLAIGLGLVWLLVIENLVRGFGTLLDALDVVQRYLPGTNAGGLVASLGATPMGRPLGTPGVTDVVGGTHAVVVLAGYLVLAAVGSALLVRRRDVT